MSDRLIVAEMFYSIQGEGVTAGVPAVFLRLGGCNLRCSGFSYVDPQSGEHLGCDSKAVWRKGKRWQCSEVLTHWQQQGWVNKLQNGAHLILTGGEPLLQQDGLVGFLQRLDQQLPHPCYIEIETNATILPKQELLQRINQINASPKLSNSGEAFENVYTQSVLREYAALDKVYFKFVLSHPSDVTEVIERYVNPFRIPPSRVLLMAEGGTQAALDDKVVWIVEACKEHGFTFSPRLQVRIWGEVTGV